MSERRVHLVRHGESEWNAAGRWQGQADPALSADGHRQAAELALWCTSMQRPPVRIVSSDLQRARMTAMAVARALDVELDIDERLREIDVGNWSGQTRAQIAAASPDALLRWDTEGVSGWSGGESISDHAQRCASFVAELRDLTRHGDVLVVSHGGTIRQLLHLALELPVGGRRRFGSIMHCGLSTLDVSTTGIRLAALNVPTNAGTPR